jgi:hypothetical protein
MRVLSQVQSSEAQSSEPGFGASMDPSADGLERSITGGKKKKKKKKKKVES